MPKAHKNNRNGPREPKEFEEEVIQIARVTRVVKGGRRLRFRATVVIGNKKGKVGFGTGKSVEVAIAIQKAVAQAKKHLVIVPMVKDTIPHDVRIKYKSAQILLMPAGPGTGIIAGGPMRKVLELAGVKNVLSKLFGTSNKLVNTQAAFVAISKLKRIPGMDRKEAPKGEVSEEKVAPKPEAKKPVTTPKK